MKKWIAGGLLTAACAFAAAVAAAESNAYVRVNYPGFVRARPQLTGVMLGASGEREFADLHRMGATLVRYQMHGQWATFAKAADPMAAFRRWMDGQLDHLAEMLPWARRYGIMICVDQHTHIGGMTDEKYSSDMIFVEKKYEDLLVETWETIARRFKGNDDVIYAYDLFNEPIDRENKLVKRSWREVMCRLVESIRAIDPVTPIVIEPNCNASPRGFDLKNPYGLKGFELLPYDNLIYSVHVYQPMGFTHQGLFKRREDWKPQPYPSANAKLDPNRTRYPGDLGPDSASGEVWDREFVRREIQSVRDVQLKTGARIFVGEFSAAAYAPGADEYIADLCAMFKEYGWDWTYHAFREATCWSFEHEGPSFYELKPAAQKTRRQQILETYMQAAKAVR
ncbi:MAG: glycoside hydrolase family 5 protein [Kiritimatiellia bacterium]